MSRTYVETYKNSILKTTLTFIYVASLAIITSACSMKANLSTPEGSSTGTTTSFKVKIDKSTLPSNRVDIVEGSSVVVFVNISPARTKDTVLNVGLTSANAGSVNTRFLSYASTLTIPAGSNSAVITLNTIDDAVSQNGSEDFTLSLSSNESKIDLVDSSLLIRLGDNESQATLAFSSASQNVAETAGTATIPVTLSASSSQAITVNYAVTGGTATGGGTDYTLASGTLTFNPGQTSKNITMTIVDDAIYEGDKTVIVTLSSPTVATLGAQTTHTVTIQDNELPMGAFTITGIAEASGTSVTDAVANNTTPRVVFAASTNATSYDVSILADDDTTVVCAVQNTATTAYTMTGCTLSVSTYYRARVVAKLGTATLAASNANYRFYVNAPPALGTNGNGPWYVMQNSSITIQAQWAAAPVVGVATDADGDTLSFTNLGTANKGTLTNNTTNIVYTAGATSFGKDTFTVTVVDARGGELSTTITIHVMTATTWTGGSSNTWSSAATGNWCGAINANKNGCTNAGPVPTTTHTAIIDDTCTGTNCSPTTNYAVSVQGLKIAGSSLTQGTGQTLTVGSSGFAQTAGTFTGSNSNISISGSFSGTGGTFNASTAIMTIYTLTTTFGTSYTFNHNSGTVRMSYDQATSTNTIGSQIQFYNFKLDPPGPAWYNFNSSTFDVLNNFTVGPSACGSGGGQLNSGTIKVYGDVLSTGSCGPSGSTIVQMVGSSNKQVNMASGSKLPALEIAKTGGATVTLVGTITVTSHLTVTSGTLSAGTSTLILSGEGGNFNVNTPSQTFNNLTFGLYSHANLQGNTITVTGTTSVYSYSGFIFNINNGTVNVQGNMNIGNGASTFGASGSANMVFNGSGNQTISTNVGKELSNVTINKATGNLTISGTPNFYGNFSYTPGAGSVDAGTSTVSFYTGSNSTISAGGITFYNVVIAPWSWITYDLNGSTLVASNEIALDTYQGCGGGTGYINNGTLETRGTLRNIGSCGSTGNATIAFKGTAANGTFTKTGPIPSGTMTIDKAGFAVNLTAAASLQTAQSVNVVAGTFNMAGFNLTIPGTLTLAAGTNVTRNGSGVLTVNGSTVSNGVYSSGSVDP